MGVNPITPPRTPNAGGNINVSQRTGTLPVITTIEFAGHIAVDDSLRNKIHTYPASLPAPQIHLHIVNDRLQTEIAIAGETATLWTGDEGTHSSLDGFEDSTWRDWGADTYEALYEWAEDIHEEIHGLVESITIAALTAETKLAVITTAMACPTKAASDTDQTIQWAYDRMASRCAQQLTHTGGRLK
jgi:hypothetical protein